MACYGCGIPNLEDEPLIIDIHKILSDEAWVMFRRSCAPVVRPFLRRSNFIFEVADNYLTFEHIEQEMLSFNVSAKESTGSTGSKSLVLNTKFSNDTDNPQTYQFKYSKTKTTSIEVTYQQGYTLGAKASFTVGTPKIVGGAKLTLEAGAQYEVTDTQRQTFQEAVTMETTSDITVEPRKDYVASIRMDERSFSAAFWVRMRMSMPRNKVLVYIRRKKDKSLVYLCGIRDLYSLFEMKEMCSAVREEDDDNISRNKVDFRVEGHMKGSIAVDHDVRLSDLPWMKTATEETMDAAQSVPPAEATETGSSTTET